MIASSGDGWRRELRENESQPPQEWGGRFRRSPLIGLLLNADEMVVGEPVSAGDVLRLNGWPPIAHHHVQDGNRRAESRKGYQEGQRRETAPGRDFLIHP